MTFSGGNELQTAQMPEYVGRQIGVDEGGYRFRVGVGLGIFRGQGAGNKFNQMLPLQAFKGPALPIFHFKDNDFHP
jgi:hypothetical protein